MSAPSDVVAVLDALSRELYLVVDVCRRGANDVVRGWELAIVVDGKPTTIAFSARPVAGGVALVGSLVPQDYADAVAEAARAFHEIVELNREIARRKLRLEESNQGIRQLHEELAQQADRLRSSNEVKGRLVASVSHELRTPLHSILGLSRLLLDESDGALSQEQRTQVQFIRDSAIKVLHTSATFVSTTSKVQGLESGADGYLTQPFEPQDLVATVRALIWLRAVEVDLQARNEALRAADRRKDEFLAMLAHELRNPLAAVQMGLPILGRFPPRDELEGRTLEIVRRQTGLLVQLVNDLLDVSRVTRGRIELTPEVLDLAALATRVCDGMRARAMAPREQRLAVAVPGAPVLVRGDAGRLEQVLTNLLDNASKYSDPGTRIDVEIEVDGDRAVLVVRDAGIGIDPAALPTIFDLFAQVPTSLARSRGGLGIGLTLVKVLVELHGGSITAASEGRGRGTSFRVVLPLHAGLARSAPPPSEAAEPPPCRVLVVDDNEDGREMLRALCELGGHEVIEAADGLDGVSLALAELPDIAFVDIGLPGIDGYAKPITHAQLRSCIAAVERR